MEAISGMTSTCYGWTCPACGHHWISVFSIKSVTCRCGYHKPRHDHVPYAVKLARAKRRRQRELSAAPSNLRAVAIEDTHGAGLC